MDRIVDVYSAANGLEAHRLGTILKDKGIRSQIVGESLKTAAGRLPLGDTLAPRIWVREGDAGRAREIIEECTSQPCHEWGKPAVGDGQSAAGPDEDASMGSDDVGELADGGESRGPNAVAFLCQECGKDVTFPGWCRGHVETCPHCGKYLDVPNAPAPVASRPVLGRTGRPKDPLLLVSEFIQNGRPVAGKTGRPRNLGPDPRTSTQLWIEVLAVLSLAYLPEMFNAITSITGWLPAQPPSPFAYHMLFVFIRSLRVAMPVLVIMALSRDQWRLFGIVRPRWIADAVGGCVICLVAMMAQHFIISLLPPAMSKGMVPRTASGKTRRDHGILPAAGRPRCERFRRGIGDAGLPDNQTGAASIVNVGCGCRHVRAVCQLPRLSRGRFYGRRYCRRIGLRAGILLVSTIVAALRWARGS